jgi:predicted phosphoadenosine phosphosulfate sulfurtransferase
MKYPLGINVLDAARSRISKIFDEFENISVSFSGGKDSSVMLHLVMDEAVKRRVKVSVLMIDLEAHYKTHINHAIKMFEKYQDHIIPYWVCLPIALRNAVSVYEPKWKCWDPDAKGLWVRNPPKFAITDVKFFDFFRVGMEFEDFVSDFNRWLAKNKKTAIFIGIRADESYNRYLKVKVKKNREFLKDPTGKDLMWALKQKSAVGQEIYSVHPIYDWRTEDIWRYNAKFKAEYAEIYDLMQKAGVGLHQQRICQPYGDDQRKGLWLYHIIEPETWGKVVARVAGVNSGAEFVKVNGNISGQIKISKPDGHTWHSFAKVLLESMPEHMKEHYKNKIFRFIEWYEKNGWTDNDGIRYVGAGCVPDEASNDLEVSKKAPSWRRVCKMLLRNDYWGKTIGFVQNKDGFFYKRYMERLKKERDKMKMENYRKAGYWKGFM